MNLLYFINGIQVTREYMARYLWSIYGGVPESIIVTFEDTAISFFRSTGQVMFVDNGCGAAITLA